MESVVLKDRQTPKRKVNILDLAAEVRMEKQNTQNGSLLKRSFRKRIKSMMETLKSFVNSINGLHIWHTNSKKRCLKLRLKFLA